jgi:cobalt-zinc-cadmium efflux system protein
MSRHSHSHAHDHVHGHTHAPAPITRRLTIALWLTLALLGAEVAGGLVSNSLALLADAGHVLTDAGALGLSLFVAWLARQPGKAEKTYGYLRWEILAAFLNGATLLLISVWIIVEALMRLRNPEPIGGGMMLAVASGGLVVNAIALWLLHGVHDGGLNIRGAYLHVLSDLVASAATVIAALIVRSTGWLAADPVVSFLSTALIMVGAWRLVRESVDVLLEAAPRHIPLDNVRRALESIDGVERVHDLHVWTLTSGMIAMSAHAIVREASQHQTVLERAHDALTAMGIHHLTLQLERCEMTEREGHLHP